MKRRWYKYPEGYIENFLPWYLIIRRLIFLPFVVLSFVLLYLSVALGWGIEDAERLKEDIF